MGVGHLNAACWVKIRHFTFAGKWVKSQDEYVINMCSMSERKEGDIKESDVKEPQSAQGHKVIIIYRLHMSAYEPSGPPGWSLFQFL